MKNKVLKLQRIGLINPTVVEYEGKVLATNQLDIKETTDLWRYYFHFYPDEKIDLAMSQKNFDRIQQKMLSSVKSVYEFLCGYNFIPRVFKATEQPTEWSMCRTSELKENKEV